MMNLCYVHLLQNDYMNAIKTGNAILRNLSPNSTTKFIINQYLAEAYSMIGQST